MKNIAICTLLGISIVLGFIFLRERSDKNNLTEVYVSRELKLKTAIDSITSLYREAKLDVGKAMDEFALAKRGQWEAEAWARNLKYRNDDLKKLLNRYSDAGLDSVLATIR